MDKVFFVIWAVLMVLWAIALVASGVTSLRNNKIKKFLSDYPNIHDEICEKYIFYFEDEQRDARLLKAKQKIKDVYDHLYFCARVNPKGLESSYALYTEMVENYKEMLRIYKRQEIITGYDQILQETIDKRRRGILKWNQ
jgi:hypothetical protein